MTSFRFDPISLVVTVPDPPVLPADDPPSFETIVTHARFMTRYLHERVHWLQHFSTQSGLFQLVKAEAQAALIRMLLTDLGASLSPDDFPLREKHAASSHMQAWTNIELFGALLAGERRRDHFERAYGTDWVARARQGGHDLSRLCIATISNNFNWPGPDLLPQSEGTIFRRLTLIEDQDRQSVALGANSLFELHSSIAEIVKFDDYVRTYTEFEIAFEEQFPAHAATLRQKFYELSGLQLSWKSELVLSHVTWAALNVQPVLFLQIQDEIEDLAQILPVQQFSQMCSRLQPYAEQIGAIEAGSIHEFVDRVRPCLKTALRYDFADYAIGMMETITAKVDYRPAQFSDAYLFEESTRLNYIGSVVSRVAAIAREEPLFVTCPGHLYTIARDRFLDLYARIGHIVEYRHGVGFGPSPVHADRAEWAEYCRHVMMAMYADLYRRFALSEFSASATVAAHYGRANPDFAPLHLKAAHSAISDLNLPEALTATLRDALMSEAH